MWDARTRIDLLLLRQFAKIIACARDSTHFRALCLSADSLTHARRVDAAGKDSHKGRTHHQPWIQQVVAAAARFGIEAPLNGFQCFDVAEVRMGLVGVCVFESDGQRTDAYDVTVGGRTSTVVNGQLVKAFDVAALAARADLGQLQLGLFDLRATQQWWSLPAGTKFTNALAWSPVLHDATFAILDRLGRQCALKIACAERAAASATETQIQRYIATKNNHDLRSETYLNLPPRLARPLYLSRADNQHNEESARRRPVQPFNSTRIFPRIFNRVLRPCYNCAALAPAVYHCESLLHVLLRCPVFDTLRAAFRADMAALVAEVHAISTIDFAGAPAPDINNDTAFATLVRCATAANPGAILQAAVIANPTAVQARSNPPYQHDAAVAARTAAWLHTVSTVARRRYAGAYEVFVVRSAAIPEFDTASLACNRLIERIAAFNAQIFSRRHALLRNNAEFARRSRDPPAPAPAAAAGAQHAPPAPP